MFQRRQPLSTMQQLREFFWPSMGWRRSILYIKHRLVRLSDSSHKIALGLAIGAGVSFTPLVGTHFIQAGFITYLLRGNVLSAVIGTFAGNPWTFPFMWWAAIEFGAFLFSLMGLPADTTIPENFGVSMFIDMIINEPFRIILPWAVGGYVACIISIPFTYFFFFRMVKAAKLARAKARLRKMTKAGREMTKMN